MASEFVGAIVGMRTKTIWNFISPQHDSELDDPRWVLAAIPKFEPVHMVRIPRKSWETCVKTPIAARLMIDLVLRLERQRHG